MNPANIKMLIGEYLDGELSSSSEKELFNKLAESEDLRIYFRNILTLKNSLKLSEEPVPISVEKNILTIIKPKPALNKTEHFNYKLAFALGFSACLLFISLYLFNKNMEIKTEINEAVNRINEQDKKMELILNSLPSAEIKPVYYKEITIQSN
jgi:hypothetical protein